MLVVTARLFKDNQLVGYRLSDGQQEQNLSVLQAWMYAKNKQVQNVVAIGNQSDPGLSGTNGFELKKLPQIKWEDTVAPQLAQGRGLKFTTQDLCAAGVRHLPELLAANIETTDDLLRFQKQALKQDCNSGLVTANNLRTLSPYIKVLNTLGSTQPNCNIAVMIPTGEELEKQKEEFKSEVKKSLSTVKLLEIAVLNVMDTATALVEQYGTDKIDDNIIEEMFSKCITDEIVAECGLSKEEAQLGFGSLIDGLGLDKDNKDAIKNLLKQVAENKIVIDEAKAAYKESISKVKEDLCNATFVPKKVLGTTSAVIGYKIEYTGPVPIRIERITADESHTRIPYTIQPNSTICLSRAEMTLMCSRPEISFLLANGKIVESSKKRNKTEYEALHSKYFSFNKTAGGESLLVNDADVKIPIDKAVDAKTLVTFFEPLTQPSPSSSVASSRETTNKIKKDGLFNGFKR